MDLLAKFEVITDPQLDLPGKYLYVLGTYSKELEAVRRIYQTDKTDPSVSRNLPPIAGRIAWSRQLFRRIDTPMKVFRLNAEILKVKRRTR